MKLKSSFFTPVLVLTAAATVASLSSCTKKSEEQTNPATSGATTTTTTTTTQQVTTQPSGAPSAATTPDFSAYKDTKELKIEDQKPGTGAEATPGKKVTVHYTGWLTNGTKFDSSVDRGQPFSFPLGAGAVIQGWDKGVAGMKVGGKRRLIIPSQLGYGERGAGNAIPPNSVLVFDVELLGVE